MNIIKFDILQSLSVDKKIYQTSNNHLIDFDKEKFVVYEAKRSYGEQIAYERESGKISQQMFKINKYCLKINLIFKIQKIENDYLIFSKEIYNHDPISHLYFDYLGNDFVKSEYFYIKIR